MGVQLYKSIGADKIGKALAEAILNKTIKTSTASKVIGNIKAGAKVKIKAGAVYGGISKGKKVPTVYLGKKYTVTKVCKNNGQQEALIKQLNSWVPTKYLIIV